MFVHQKMVKIYAIVIDFALNWVLMRLIQAPEILSSISRDQIHYLTLFFPTQLCNIESGMLELCTGKSSSKKWVFKHPSSLFLLDIFYTLVR